MLVPKIIMNIYWVIWTKVKWNKHFSVSNSSSILSNQTTADENISRDSIIEYPHLISFDLFRTCTQIIDQFLNENKTRLPRLGHLTIQYEDLRNVTQDFTREATRYNCANVTKLTTYREMVGSKQFHLYFPLLWCHWCEQQKTIKQIFSFYILLKMKTIAKEND